MPSSPNALTATTGIPIVGRAHIPALDGLRGMAILMVLAIHFYPKALIADTYPTLTSILGRLVAVGGYGVELFFVLSGFLITGILVDTKGEKHFLGKFYARRTLRIFPLYYATLVVLLLLLPACIDIDEGAKSIVDRQHLLWTYMANWPVGWVWDDSTMFKLGHFWSLCVEEHFYLVWPALVAVLPIRRVFHAALILVAMGLLSRVIAVVAGPSTLPLFEWTTLQKLDGLAVGAIIAIAVRDPSLAQYVPTGRTFHRWTLVLLAATLAYLFLPRRLNVPIFGIVGETIVVGLFGLVLLGVIRTPSGSRTHRLMTSSAFVTLGKYSYGLYVIHGVIRPLLSQVIDFSSLPKAYGSPFLYLFGYYAAAISISFFLAYLSYHLFEKHFLNLKRHFDYVRKPAAAPDRIAPSTVSAAHPP